MKVAYIAGPYRAETEWKVLQNIRRAEVVAQKYWNMGYAVICPHKNSAYMGNGAVSDKQFLAGDLEIIRRCDVVVMMPEWMCSAGATAELALAQDLGKEIIFEDEE